VSLPEPVADLQPGTGALIDRFARSHSYLRVSVTDRCNYRCTYCLPAEGVQWMQRSHVMSLEEIARAVRAFVGLGVRRVRLTGGEPTVRRGILDLVRMLKQIDGLQDLAMTTNGHLFAPLAQEYADAGLDRVNISIDTVDPEGFKALTRGGDVHRVLAAIEASRAAGLGPVKLNCVVVRGVNDAHILDFIQYFARWPDVIVRFIEYMPFSGNEAKKKHVPVSEIRQTLFGHYTVEPAERLIGGGPAVNWRLAETGQVVGFISPITEHFCHSCNRLRLQADGHLRTCLSRDDTPSLRDLLRGGIDDGGLQAAIRDMVWAKVPGHEAHQLSDWRAFEGVMTQIGG